MLASLLFALVPQRTSTIVVGAMWELRSALAAVKPGTTILLKPGKYEGGGFFTNVHGAAGRPVVVASEDSKSPAKFVKAGLQFAEASYLEIRNLSIEGAAGNAIGIDDGGSYDTPAHHITLIGLHIIDVSGGGSNGIKMAGVDDFRIEDCQVERWGGCAIDMVGCHRGTIYDCRFKEGGGVGVQAKGASSDIAVLDSMFERFGGRGVNIGGSTGAPYFRPSLERIPAGKRYEAKDILVKGCTFIGGDAPVAFAGADGSQFRENRVQNPAKWAIRILQESTGSEFVPCRNGRFEDNSIEFQSTWSEGGVNIGPGTAPKSFRFRRNRWYCSDRPGMSVPSLPVPEEGGVYGKN